MRPSVALVAALVLCAQAAAEESSEEIGIIPSLSFEGDNIVASLLKTTDETVELFNSLVPRNPDLPAMIWVKFAYCERQTVELCLEQAEGESFRREVEGVTQTMLTKQLRALEEAAAVKNMLGK